MPFPIKNNPHPTATVYLVKNFVPLVVKLSHKAQIQNPKLKRRVPKGRAIRYNLFVARKMPQKGFPLLSLREKKTYAQPKST
jgi:hypothetical protein